MADYCRRCGYRDLADPEFCFRCADGIADEGRTTALVEATAGGNRDAMRVLSAVNDPRALSVLLAAADHELPAVRRAALEALDGLADPAALDVARRNLLQEDRRVRQAAIILLADLGPLAADALATRLDHPEDAIDAATALAWLRDPRALEVLGPAAAADPVKLAYDASNLYRNPILGLGWLANEEACGYLVRATQQIMLAADRPPGWQAHQAASLVASALGACAWPEAIEAAERIRARFGALMPIDPGLRPPAPVPPAPHADRTVARWSFVLQPVDEPIREPVTKFGGQPFWLGAPTWPLGSDGLPAMFLGQFAMPGDARLSYLFIDPSWDPGEERSQGILFAQPGVVSFASGDQATGPTYPSERSDFSRFGPDFRMARIESRAILEPAAEPPDWASWDLQHEDDPEDGGSWNKVGGTPRWLQGDEAPDGDGWHFWFQYTAADIGYELGDGAECYGFLHDDGRGTFIVQSH